MSDSLVSIEELKAIPLFRELSNPALEMLSKASILEVCNTNEMLFYEGQRGDRFYVVLQGGISISRHIDGIGEEQISVCRQGAHFGELAMIDSSPRSANARAIEDSVLLVLHRSVLEELMFSDPVFAREILWGFVKQLGVSLREVNEKLRASYQQSLF